MTITANSLPTALLEYCAKLGADPLLVQGAGGNVSWKNADTLWVKASGTWLANAAEKNIFVAVDLSHLREALHNGNFAVTPKLSEKSSLRPSIETLLHALMPHPIVVHLHAIEVLAHLVREGWQTDLQSRLNNTSIRWTVVDYKKPGADLAAGVNMALNTTQNVDVIFLQNHGIVIGGEDIIAIEQILQTLLDLFRTTNCASTNDNIPLPEPVQVDRKTCYYPVADHVLHRLATEINLFNQLRSAWALYPDHVVFLGASPCLYDSIENCVNQLCHNQKQPELIFIKGKGTFVIAGFSAAKNAQLRGYYDILIRQQQHSQALKTLTTQQIDELLNWDSEQYRIGLCK